MVLWQDAQDTVPVEDKRGSWYKILPNSTFSAVVGLSAGAGAVVGKASAAATAIEPVNAIADTSKRNLNIHPPNYYCDNNELANCKV
jgi:hypothetical protein